MNHPTSLHQHIRTPQIADDLGEQESLVEHLSIPGFMSRFQHRWHMDDINRFGKQVGRTAEDLQLAYMTINDRSLGVIRVFPVPLLARIYQLLRGQFGWPEAPALLPGGATPRPATNPATDQRLAQHLQALLDATEDRSVQACIAGVLQYLDQREKAGRL